MKAYRISFAVSGQHAWVTVQVMADDKEQAALYAVDALPSWVKANGSYAIQLIRRV